ncbi:Mitochondrial/chloroplast ribosomal protein L15/L10 [Handroanthus impetiginosus]|uniref:Mitochondrial/chloroplast ribosomal protein L15/L10 n=1 Tax=Handroanthus impetiginosus TaxID=429701 RepID=A0A2G9HX29_9LAMI|nr:Mitochondrial/chloroplast ribosomal protein L15/L10 [Handroanthus impetiginosus]
MAASLLSLSSPNPSTTTPQLHQLSSHFKGNVRTLKGNPSPFPYLRLCHNKAKQRQSVVIVNSAASGVQESSLKNVRFRLDNLGPQPGSTKKAKRKGRGHAAGQGGSCGFGMRGQKSRSGPGVRKGFEGGQMPLYRRIPKLRGIAGGMHAGLPKYVPVNLKDIEEAGFQEGEEVSLESLKKKGVINPSGRERKLPLKILGDGELSVKLNFKARAFSSSAKEKLEGSGCSLTVLPGQKKWVKPSVAKNLARAEEYFAKKRAASESAETSSA